MRYEHMFITQAYEVTWDGTARQHAEQLLRVAREFVPRFEADLDTYDGGGWETVSHHILPAGDGAVISLLVRRVAREDARRDP